MSFCNKALYGPIDIGEPITTVLPVDTASHCDDHESAVDHQMNGGLSGEVSEHISDPLSSSTSIDFDLKYHQCTQILTPP